MEQRSQIFLRVGWSFSPSSGSDSRRPDCFTVSGCGTTRVYSPETLDG